MNDKPQPGAGDVEITLDGQKVTLKPSLDACLALSRIAGGLYGPGALSERIRNFDLDAYVIVIRAGLSLTGNAVRDLDQQVYRTGMVNLLVPLSAYIQILGNGGRPVREGSGEGDTDQSPPDPAAVAS